MTQSWAIARIILASVALVFAARTMGSQSPPTTRPAGPVFQAEVIAKDLRAPWAIGFVPDGRVFFTEREGRVRVIDRAGKLLDQPALVVADIRSWSKMGLLGLAIDPNFVSNYFVYLSECHGVGNGHDDNHVRVVRYREADNKLTEPKVLLDGIPAFHNHAGGRLLFAKDGTLFITTGDADEPVKTQRLDDLRGKILRINADGTIPADNPFLGRPDARPEIWSFGHRNPQGLAFQPGTGRLFETEHGPDGGDEINLIRRGGNYGWPFVTHDKSASGVNSPLTQFTPSVGPGDCVFYDGDMFPELRGDLLVAAMRGESILRVGVDGESVTSVERLIFKEFGRLREIAVAPDGAIWVTTSEFDPPEGRKTDGYDQILRLTSTGRSLATVDPPPAAKDLPRPVGAKAIYAARCIACHGDGSDGSLNSNLFDRKWDLSDGSDDALRQIIRDGRIDRGMPGFAESLTPAEIDSLIAYVRQREVRR